MPPGWLRCMIPASDEAGVPQQGGIFRDQFRSHVGPSGFPRDVERLAKLVTDDLSRPRPRNFANEVDAARHRPAVELSLLWPRERTLHSAKARSEKCQEQTHAALRRKKHGPDHPIIGRLRLAASSQL